MAAAVFLKDNGYSVAVIEKDSRVGGQCNTYELPDYPAQWLDIGVVVFPNTAAANAAGLGPWNISTTEIVKRFAGPDAIIPQFLSSAVGCVMDLELGYETCATPAQAQQSEDNPAFLEAYETFQQIITQKYPWIDLAQVPDPVPSELLLPFSVFIENNNLTALIDSLFLPFLVVGGLGSLQNLTTLYALLNLGPTTNFIFEGPNNGFQVNHGCQTVYDGMYDYIGAENVFFNTTVSARLDDALILFAPSQPFLFELLLCSNIVVAFPPTINNMLPLISKSYEFNLFSQVKLRDYFTGVLSGSGSFNNYSVAQVETVNLLNQPFLTPPLPGLTSITQTIPEGLMQLKASSPNSLSISQMEAILSQQLATVPPSLLVNLSIKELLLHNFQPHLSAAALQAGTYQQLKELQGVNNIYYTGAMFSYSATFQIWNQAYLLVQEYFPPAQAGRKRAQHADVAQAQ